MDQPIHVGNPTKTRMRDILSDTMYDRPGLVDGLHLVLAKGSDQLHTCAICSALVCMSFTEQNLQQQQVGNQGPTLPHLRDPNTIIPTGCNIYPPEIAILLKSVDEEDRNHNSTFNFKCNNGNVTRNTSQVRFVTREEFNKHMKQFHFVEKWKHLGHKIKDVVGISTQKASGDTMNRYLKNFLAVVSWLNRTNKLSPGGDFTANVNNLNLCGTFNENYFYEQVQGDTTEQQVVDKTKSFQKEYLDAITTVHTYLGDKKLRHLNGVEESITAALNLGCAANYGLTNQAVVKKKCNLVVGLVEYLSDFSMARLAAMVGQPTVPGALINELYTIGSRPIAKPTIFSMNKFKDWDANNLFLEWESPVLFPTLAKKFPNNIVFQEIFVDHLVHVEMASFRKRTTNDFYQRLLPQLRSAKLIDDETTVYIPFTPDTTLALHASWRTVSNYATITFVKKNDGCAWHKATTNDDLQRAITAHNQNPECHTLFSQVGVDKHVVVTSISSTAKSMFDNGKKKKKRDANGNVICHDQKVVDNLNLALEQWQKCTDDTVKEIGWIKMQFKKEVGNSKHIIKYPIDVTEIAGVPEETMGPVPCLELSCDKDNVGALSQFLEDNPEPRMVLKFKDNTSTSLQSLVVSKSFRIVNAEATTVEEAVAAAVVVATTAVATTAADRTVLTARILALERRLNNPELSDDSEDMIDLQTQTYLDELTDTFSDEELAYLKEKHGLKAIISMSQEDMVTSLSTNGE